MDKTNIHQGSIAAIKRLLHSNPERPMISWPGTAGHGQAKLANGS
jgi:hypothetical protein